MPLRTMMNDCEVGVRMPAEWEDVGAVIVAWPHENTDWAYMLDEVQKCYIELIHAISQYANVIVLVPEIGRVEEFFEDIPKQRIKFFEVPTNDTWTRDYGVITTIDSDGNPILNDFGFNAWGGKFISDKDNAVTSAMVNAKILKGKYVDRNHFYLEGGSIESDGQGIIMTTESCLLTDTRNREYAVIGSKKPYEEYLEESLGAKKILWVDSGNLDGDDTDGHIDTIARLAPDNTIIYCGCGKLDDVQSKSLRRMKSSLESFTNLEGNPFRLIELPMPDPIYDEEGLRLPATYANYLAVNNAILMPVYGQPDNDNMAKDAIKKAFPNHEIKTVNCRALIHQHGSLHCATMQVPPYAINTNE